MTPPTLHDEDLRGGSGRGGDMGTPTKDLDMAPPSTDQDQNEVVSGGGVADQGEDDHQ